MTQSSGSLFVKSKDGTTLELTFDRFEDTTLKEVQKEVYSKNPSLWEPFGQDLIFKQKVLPRSNGKLSDYGIKPKDVIEMRNCNDSKDKSVEIVIKCLHGEKVQNISLNVKLSCNSILSVKKID
ncbi:hypothetical protein RFI_18143 [Reticulomyxa filosa]|uniref:Ubiquitin-like domain-containing protein n=1 Tax=Reticulomyxa filosa TaxID=46433 RepID=X6MYI4_RETFI|nr:hypothetical protein RFI_18143 [Reticulomyxa filosa]|eukprot:ETO19095.1 hypothetical protein RFI_18143 [Reticulomyxa filosa]